MLDAAHKKQNTELAGSGYSSNEEALKAGAEMFAPAALLAKREVQFHVVNMKDGSFGVSNPHVGEVGATQNREPSRSAVMRIADVKSINQSAHTHWDDNLKFSGADARYVNITKLTLALINREGQMSNLTRRSVNRRFKQGTRLVIPPDARIKGKSLKMNINMNF